MAQVELEKGGGKGIIQLAWPLVISFTMRSLFNFVDTFYASILGEPAIAAIGLTIPLEFVFIATWVGLSNGLTSLLAKALGAREPKSIDQFVRTAYRLVMIVGPGFVVFGGAVYLMAPRMGFDPEVGRNLAIYAGTITAGTGVTGFWSIIPDSIVKAHHDTRTTMIAGILSNLVNVGLNTLFLFVFHWGIFGIAFSTVASRFAGLAYALVRARQLERAAREDWARHPERTSDRVDPRPFRALLWLAIPSSMGYLLMSLESTIVAWLLAGLPDATPSVAAWSIFFRFYVFGITPLIAGSVALLPYVARAWGRHDLVAIRAGFRTLLVASAGVVILLLGPVYIGFAEPIVRILVEDPRTVQLGIFSLRLAPIACLVTLPFLLCRPVFEGMQKSIPGMWVAILRYAILTLPFGLVGLRIALGADLPGYYGVLTGLMAATGCASAVFMVWTRVHLRSAERELFRPGAPSFDGGDAAP